MKELRIFANNFNRILIFNERETYPKTRIGVPPSALIISETASLCSSLHPVGIRGAKETVGREDFSRLRLRRSKELSRARFINLNDVRLR